MIAIRSLEFAYGESAFRLSVPALDLDAGGKLALIGPSGCGKTTLLHLVAGILLPTAGCINVHGVEVQGLGDRARRDFRIANIGFVFQGFELLDYLDALDNVLHPYRINDSLRLGPEVRTRALELARETGIGDKLGRRVNQLSQGERQRVAICRALVTRPRVLLADEATGNLDPDNRDRIVKILGDYVERESAVLLAATHDHELLGAFDRVLDLRDIGAEA